VEIVHKQTVIRATYRVTNGHTSRRYFSRYLVKKVNETKKVKKKRKEVRTGIKQCAVLLWEQGGERALLERGG
jgi:hypothetical protein